MEKPSFFGKPWLVNFIVVFALLAGLAIRLLDLTDLPLDFHPTRQLYSAIKARGMYYQIASDVSTSKRDLAIQLWKEEIVYEPPVLDTLVAGTYVFTGEHLWIARIYSSIFWLLGGLALFALTRKLASIDGALIALFYYVFLYFGVLASRSFQPDPLMVALILASLWAFVNWTENKSWKWTIITSLLSGLAIFVKPPMAAFLLLGAYAFFLLGNIGLRPAIKDRQVWTLALLTAIPTAFYMIDGMYIQNFLNIRSSLRFFPNLWTDPVFYIRWYNLIGNTVGIGAFLLSLLTIFLLEKKYRTILIGLWFGYLAYGFTFAHFISTHNYYQLPLIPIVSISLGIAAKTIFDRIADINSQSLYARPVIIVFILLGIVNSMWDVRVTLMRDDYRSEAGFWEKLGDKLGHNSKVIGLTQDYGHRLAYFGWQDSSSWLVEGDLNIRELGGVEVNLEDKFAQAVADNQYFVVTMFGQLDSQPKIKTLLYDNYPVFDEGDGYIIFDLQHPISK